MSVVSYPHISIVDGAARIGRSRYKVLHLAAEHYHHGWSAEELLRQHPDLRPEEVYSALTYFYDHYDEMVTRINVEAASAVTIVTPLDLSRGELLRRREDAT
jgi:uncharacterized protein (DUF433 family)